MAAHFHSDIRELMYGNDVQTALGAYWDELDHFSIDSYDCELALRQLQEAWEQFQIHLSSAFQKIHASDVRLSDSFYNRLSAIKGYAERAAQGLTQTTQATVEHQEEAVRNGLLYFTGQFLSLQEQLRYASSDVQKKPRRRWW